MLTRLRYPPIRLVQGKYAQTVAAVVVGVYAGISGLYVAQIVCGLTGLGG
jgi:hypothetical protein